MGKRKEGVRGVWTKCLQETESSRCFSTPSNGKRFSRREGGRGGEREGERERERSYRLLGRVWELQKECLLNKGSLERDPSVPQGQGIRCPFLVSHPFPSPSALSKTLDITLKNWAPSPPRITLVKFSINSAE